MSNEQNTVENWHRAFGAPVADAPTLIPGARSQLRHDLIAEELEEYATAVWSDDIVEIADALGDLLWVVYGTAAEHGIDLDPVFEEVARSNFSKLGADGQPIFRSDGKILKSDLYSPPVLGPLLKEQGAQL